MSVFMDNQNTLELLEKSVFNTSTMKKYLSRDQYSKIKVVLPQTTFLFLFLNFSKNNHFFLFFDFFYFFVKSM